MRPRRWYPIAALLIPLLLLVTLFHTDTESTKASEFAPEPPNFGAWLLPREGSATAAGTPGFNPNNRTFVNIPSPSANFQALNGGSSPEFDTADDAEIITGAVLLTVNAPATLGIANGACATTIPTSFVMMDATTSGAAVAYDVAVSLAAPGITTTTQDSLTYTSGGDPVGIGDEIQIDVERMRVIGQSDTANTLTVQRGFAGTAAATHATGAAILRGRVTSAGPATDLLRNLAEDNDGDGLPNHVEQYPAYLDVLLDPDLPLTGAPPLVPLARYSGFDSVANTTVILQVLTFAPGALRALPNSGAYTAAQGKSTLVVLQDPTQAPANASITDFCTPLTSTSNFFGQAQDNVCTPPPGPGQCATLNLGGAIQQKGGLDATSPPDLGHPCPRLVDGPAPDESGPGLACAPRFTNPGAARTVFAVLQAQSQRDFDGDGIEQALDACARADSGAYDPRAPVDPADGDNDGLDDSCDPTPAAGDTDPDSDAWLNRLDNCPTGPPNGGGTLLNPSKTVRERHTEDVAVNGNYDAGEDIYLDGGTGDNLVGAGDTLVFGGGQIPGTALVPFDSVETLAGAPRPADNPLPDLPGYERHVDSDIAGTHAGRYKTAAGDPDEAIYRDLDDAGRGVVSAGDTLIQGAAAAAGTLLIGFTPQAKHVTVTTASGLQTGDDVTYGPQSTGATRTETTKFATTLARNVPLAGGIVSWEGSAQVSPGHPDEPSVLTGSAGPVIIRFTANVNRGQADFDVAYPGQVLDGGSRGDTMGPNSAADIGCDLVANGTDGPTVPDGHYHRTATISRMCVTAVAGDDTDGDGVCKATAAVGDVEDPCDGDGEPACAGLPGACPTAGSCDSDADGVRDRVDNCISDDNLAPAGFSQADKDQDGIGDVCDTFNDSDGDGFSDRMEGATSVANDAALAPGTGAGLGAEDGTFCEGAADNDGDGSVNDGCPRAGPAEAGAACADAVDSVPLDGYVNDGCPAVNVVSATTVPAGTYMNVSVGCGVTLAGGIDDNAFPPDVTGDGDVDVSDTAVFITYPQEGTASNGGSVPDRLDISPDLPSALGGTTGDGFVDITDRGEVAGRQGQSFC